MANPYIGFEGLLYDVLVDNELSGNESLAYQLSKPASLTSGWAFGVPQFDLGIKPNSIPNNPLAGSILDNILSNATNSQGQLIISPTELSSLEQAAEAVGNGNSLTSVQQAKINSALSSPYGQQVINQNTGPWLERNRPVSTALIDPS